MISVTTRNMACRAPMSAASHIHHTLRPVRSHTSPAIVLINSTTTISTSSSTVLLARQRPFSTSRPVRDEESTLQISNKPSHTFTPPRLHAPVSVRRPHNVKWICNEDPELLNGVYRTVLGEGGDKLLTEEVKWLAVTHKSFDQGRRGFNDRLAFLGRQIVSLQVSLALLNRTDGTFNAPRDRFAATREPFRHPGVDLLPRLTSEGRAELLDTHRIAQLASRMGLMPVLRWKPRDVRNLVKSGSELVLTQALYAIIGAVALQRGGEVAVRIVKDRVINHLGLRL